MPHAFNLAEQFRRGNLEAGRALLRFSGRAAMASLLLETFEHASRSYRTSAASRVVAVQGLVGLYNARLLSAEQLGRVLAPRLHDPFEEVRAAAAHALASIDPLTHAASLHAEALAALRSALGGDAVAAVRALLRTEDGERIRSFAESAVARLIDGDRHVRLRALPVVWELALAGDAGSLRAFRALFADPDSVIRIAAIETFDPARVENGEAMLLAALAHEEGDVFARIVRKLHAMESAELRPRLAALAAEDSPRRKLYRDALRTIRR